MLKPKKSLGQNFLKDKAVARRIVDCLSPAESDTVVEVGPGTGALTEYLIESGARVYGVDIDSRMVNFLAQKYHKADNFETIHSDILDFDFSAYYSGTRLKVIGNLPYHLSSPILEKLCDNHEYVGQAVLTIQKEVAQRLVAEVDSSDYSSITIYVSNFCQAELLFDLGRLQFHPPPRVTSTVIRLNFFNQPIIANEKYGRIKNLVQTAFSQRRKMMINSLIKNTELSREQAGDLLAEIGIDPKARPQNISLQQYIKLAERLDGYALSD